MAIPISFGAGTASIASEKVGNNDYQQIKVVDGTASSTNKWTVNSDGSAQVSVAGTVAATISGTPSVSGTVNIGDIKQSVFGASVIGLPPVNLFMGGAIVSTANPVPVQPPASGSLPVTNVGSVITVAQGSVAVAIISGSIAATVTPPANQSISGTVDATQIGAWRTSVISSTPSSMLAGASIFGQLPAGTAVLGSVATLQGTNPWIITGSVQGTFSPAANQSVSGTVGASIIGTVPVTQSGTLITSIVSSTPSSVLVGASIFGQLPAGTAPLGSVATLQGTNPWIVNFQNSSIIAINAGSVVTVSQGSVISVFQSPSIVGTYAEDAAHTTGDKGLFVMQVRNDTMSSVTSADGDFSPIAGGPIGETIVANAPITKWVQGTADLRGNSGASVAVIAAQGASIFTYITGLQLANLGSASVLVTLSGATSSIIGYTVAPAGGGSNIVYPNALKTNANGAFTASISGVASVLVSAQGFIAKI